MRQLNASDHAMMRVPAATAAPTFPAPSALPTSTCAAIANASRTSAMNTNRPNATWCAASGASPIRAQDGAGRREGGQERGRPQEQLPRDPHERADELRRRPAVDARPAGAQQEPRERRAHAELGEHRADRRAVQAPLEAVDEEHLEDDVRGLRGRHDDERRAQVADAAQVSLTGERDERERQPERREAQVARREVPGLAVAAEQRDERVGEHQARPARWRRRSPSASHSACAAKPAGAPDLAGAVQAGDLRRRPVGQEDAQRR